MAAEQERLMALVAPLRARGWVFVPTTLAAPTPERTVAALFGLRTHGALEDSIQLWEQWATATRLRKVNNHEIPVWHSSGRITDIVRELLALPDDE
jgi:hypothetical protein